jgi:hypothetical protein
MEGPEQASITVGDEANDTAPAEHVPRNNECWEELDTRISIQFRALKSATVIDKRAVLGLSPSFQSNVDWLGSKTEASDGVCGYSVSLRDEY